MKERDSNDNAITRLIALFVVLLLGVATVAVVIAIVFAKNSHRRLASGDFTDYSIGAGLCLIAAVAALGTGLIAVVKLMKD